MGEGGGQGEMPWNAASDAIQTYGGGGYAHKPDPGLSTIAVGQELGIRGLGPRSGVRGMAGH